jgi:predicted dithiol-disulfide oxidoreductase (DUF899 family)
MSDRATSAKLGDYRRRIADLRREMRTLRAEAEPEQVRDYELATPQGSVRLSSLFGDKRDLIVIHNMGVSCAYCTLWADGYNGIYHHLIERAAFVVSSPDPPDVQRTFAQERGWRFPMVSHAGTAFAADMGYRSAGYPAFPYSGSSADASCECPTVPATWGTISARCGTCSICCRGAPGSSNRRSATREVIAA